MTVEHPSWCCRTDCSVDDSGHGWHHSRAILVDCHGPEFRVRVVQATGHDWTGPPLIDLEWYTPTYEPDASETEEQIAIEPRYALTLGRALISAGRAAYGTEVPVPSTVG
jgi:hypothetical protein